MLNSIFKLVNEIAFYDAKKCSSPSCINPSCGSYEGFERSHMAHIILKSYYTYIILLLFIFCNIIFYSIGLIIGFLPAMGWIGDTSGGRVCWFVTVVPSELILLTAFTGFLPLLVTVVLYGIILYHALQKIVQLKKAAARHSGHQMGTLRLFVGGRSTRNLAVASSDDEQQRSCCGCSQKRFFNCCRRYNK